MSSNSSLSRVLSPFRVQTKIEENSLPDRSNVVSIRIIMVFCIVLGDNTETAFPIKLPSDKKVGELRKLITKINPISFINIDAKDLILWQVSISDEDVERMKILNTKPPSGINIEVLGGKVMSSRKEVKFYFPEDPVDEHIHIIIVRPQPPATIGTGKRPLGDSDLGEESGTRKKEKLTYPSESEEGRDGLMVISPERLKRIADFVENRKITLLRSPPSSGKSTLGQVLRDRFDGSGYDGIYISLAGIYGKKAINDENLFNDFWFSKVGRTWTEISKSKRPTFVIIDEVQIIYGDSAPFFWGTMKDFLSSETHSNSSQNLRFLFLGTYQPTLDPKMTPITFSHTLGLNDLLLEWKEIDQLTTNFVQLHNVQGSDLLKVPDPIRRAMLNLTGGHPGLCRLILSSLRNHFRHPNDTIVVDMLRYLASSELRNSICDYSRAFHWIIDWKPSDEEAEFIRNILLSIQTKAPFNIDYGSSPICKNFIKSGIFAIVDEKIQFTAPIMRIVLSHRLFTCPANLRKPMPLSTSFENFLLRTIELMSPSSLSRSLGRGPESSGSHLYERGWQMEWYRTATSIAPTQASVSADVGPVFEKKAGFLDFYVNRELCWGIELVREGDRLLEHAQRFEGGDYANIPLKDWAIIDFRHHTKQVKGLKKNFWYILYEDNYETVTIRRSDHEDKVLALHGDDAPKPYSEQIS